MSSPESTTSLAFEGSALQVLPMHLARLLVLGALCLTLPFGLGEAVVLEVRALLTPIGLEGAWQSVEEAIRVLPWVSTGVVALLLLVAWGTIKGWMRRYRIQNTIVLGEALVEEKAGCNPIPSWIAFGLVVCTLGLASPWVIAWSKRRQYALSRSKHGPLVFTGAGLGIAGYGLFTLLSLPFVIATLGFAAIPIRYLWLRWEQSNLGVPDAQGEVLETRFTGSLLGYVRGAFVRWLLTLITLGFYRPWGLVASWRWTAAHTEIQPRPAAVEAPAEDPETREQAGPTPEDHVSPRSPGQGESDGARLSPQPKAEP